MSKSTMPTKSKRQRLLFWGGAIAAALAMGIILYSTVFPQRATFYYDSADTLYWANAMYESGRAINPDFGYVYLLPFSASLLMLPFIPLFGVSMTTHIIGMVLFDLVFFASLWFFCTALELPSYKRLALFSGLLLLLCSSDKLQELFWHHTSLYSPMALFALLFLGLVLRGLGEMGREGGPRKKRLWLWGALLFLLAVGVGTDGANVIVLCAVPVAGALMCERFFDNGTKLLARANWPAYGAVGVLGAGSLAGMALLSAMKGGFASGYAGSHLKFTYASTWMDHVLLLPGYWVKLLGVDPHSEERLTDPSAIFEFLHLAVAVLLVVLPIVAACHYKKIQDKTFRILLWYHGLVCAALLLNHIVGSTADNDWRFIPAVFSSALISILYLMQCWRAPNLRRVTAVMAACVALLCLANVRAILVQPVTGGENADYYEMVDVLKARGLSHGYGDFEVSHTVTVFSGGDVTIRNVDFDERGVAPQGHQSSSYWYNDIPGQDRYFVVMKLTKYHLLTEEAETRDEWEHMRGEAIEEFGWKDYWFMVFDENPVNLQP